MPSPMTGSHTHLPLLALHILHNTSLTNASFYVSHLSLVHAFPLTSTQTLPYQTFSHSYNAAQPSLQPPTSGTSPTLAHPASPRDLCSNPPQTSLLFSFSPSQVDYEPATITTTPHPRRTIHHLLPRLHLHPSADSHAPMRPGPHFPPPAALAPLQGLHPAPSPIMLRGTPPLYTTPPSSSRF